MKNKIVILRDGKTTLRIIDIIINKGDTEYLAIDFETTTITTIKPKDIYDILKIEGDKPHSDKNNIIE
jgi:hypothetical protein